ncbi:MAG: aminotransferase class V-fold PLP-dependent enzyme [Bacteroidota bacterium]
MLKCQKDLFQLDETVTFLNCAYMSPQLKSVEAAGRHALARKNKPNTISVEDFFTTISSVKQEYARLINAEEAGRMAIIPSVSYGIATVAKNLPLQAGQEIVMPVDQFPSNYYAWERLARENNASLRIVEVPDGPDKGLRWNQAILNAITDKTAAVAISHLHWAEGVRFDLASIRRASEEVGAWLIIDGTQSVGALPFDVQEIRPDALVCGGYKWLMGPYSIGIAYYGPNMDNGVPIEENWINRKDSHDFRNLVNYQPSYQPLAGRYCVGEHSNFLLMPMFETALQQLNAWGVENIQHYCKQLNAPFLSELKALGFSILPSEQRADHLLGVGLPEGVDMEKLQAALTAERVLVSVRGQSVRIAPNVYNEASDWEKLLTVLKAVSKMAVV